MPLSITLSNHTARRFADGSNAVGDTYKLLLATSATFTASATTLAGITYTEVANGNGYTTGGATLSNVVVTQTSNDAAFDADDVIWTASGGSIAAAYGILYCSSDSGSPPIAFIDFGGTQTAVSGAQFKVIWNAAGIVTFTVA